MHADVSIRCSVDLSSHINILVLVRWAKASKREALAYAPTTADCTSQPLECTN
jgi:hypothetical protein